MERGGLLSQGPTAFADDRGVDGARSVFVGEETHVEIAEGGARDRSLVEGKVPPASPFCEDPHLIARRDPPVRPRPHAHHAAVLDGRLVGRLRSLDVRGLQAPGGLGEGVWGEHGAGLAARLGWCWSPRR